MVILTLLDSKTHQPLQQWRFPHEGTIRIGRSPDNQVVISDGRVSRYHIELRRVPSPEGGMVWQVKNLGTNGTYLKGQAIAQAVIFSTEILQCARGGPLLKIELVGTAISLPELPVIPIRDSGICTHSGNPSNAVFCQYCQQPLHVKQVIRDYQIVRSLGQGGMGKTYLAWRPIPQSEPLSHRMGGSPARGHLVVLKEMNANLLRVPKAQELFEREAMTLQQLRHPGIPQFHDFFIEKGKPYLAMEMIHGQQMERFVLQNGPVSLPQAIAWMVQACEILDYLHSQPQPIIHRDIKPGNLIIQAVTHRIVLLDFGAVKAAGMPAETRIGAQGYSAPEQAQGRAVVQSDLFAIAPTLLFLLTAKEPHLFYKRSGKGYRYFTEQIPNLPPMVRAVIDKATQWRVRDRYVTAKDLAAALSVCLETALR